jgi:hypothetical protein
VRWQDRQSCGGRREVASRSAPKGQTTRCEEPRSFKEAQPPPNTGLANEAPVNGLVRFLGGAQRESVEQRSSELDAVAEELGFGAEGFFIAELIRHGVDEVAQHLGR